MSVVVQLRQRESVSVDSLHISAIFRRLGPAQAESAIIDGIEQLTGQMRQIDPLCRRGELAPVPSMVRSAQVIAGDLGLVSLAAALGALADACRGGDRVAASALWERVKRTGDRSFIDLWELPQLQV